MKKRWIWMLCLMAALCLAAGSALALEEIALPQSHFHYAISDKVALVGDAEVADGSLSLTINDAGTNWTDVLLDEMGTIFRLQVNGIPSGITVPDGGVARCALYTSDTDPALASLQQVYDMRMYIPAMPVEAYKNQGCGEGNFGYGEYDALNGVYVPYDASQTNFAMLVMFYESEDAANDPDAEPIDGKCYRVNVMVKHQRGTAVEVILPKVPASDIEVDSQTQGQNPPLEVKELGEGYVYYQVNDNSALTESNTYVSAPVGAAYCALGNGEEVEVNNGRIKLRFSQFGQDMAQADTYVLQFFDADYNPIGSKRQLTIRYVSPGVKAWPKYEADFQPAERVKVKNGAQSAGYQIQYDKKNGHLSAKHEGAKVPVSKLNGTISVTVQPPQGVDATHYRVSWRGSNEFLGPDDGHLRKWADQELGMNGTNPLMTISSGDPSYERKVFRPIQLEDKPVTLYLPNDVTQPDECFLMLIYWYNKQGVIVAREYLWQTTEAGPAPIDSAGVKNDPASIPDRITWPHATGAGMDNWELQNTYYVQDGQNARHYELTLTDENGIKQQPSGPVEIYLPYPEGESYETSANVKYTVSHYTEQMYDADHPDVSGDDMIVEPTEKGIKVTAYSLSPFVVAWEDTNTPPAPVPAPDVPKTGDNSPSASLLLALMLASLAGMMALRRKARA